MTHKKQFDVVQSQEWKASGRYAFVSLGRDPSGGVETPSAIILVTKRGHLGSGEQSSESLNEQTSN